jgi:tungstate transport system substrate-binding protein
MSASAYRRLGAFAALIVAVVLFGAACGSGAVILATTTSTQDSGLLDVLVPAFEKSTGFHVKIIAVGTGQALEMGRRGDADVLFVHAPTAEMEFVVEGFGTNRQLVMHNDFVVVGPEGNPAGVGAAPDALAALRAIADAEASFISRGDDSGTHKLERSLWNDLAFDPSGVAWYAESGQGMGATLQIANQRDAYTITDRATYLALRELLDLVVLNEGDPRLLNVYHVMQVSPARFDSLNAMGAAAFVDFLISDEAQELIREFGVDEFGQPLFVPDAGKSEAELGRR